MRSRFRSITRAFERHRQRACRQLQAWPKHTRWSFRFTVAGVAAWLAYEFGRVFALLPENWRDVVSANAFTVPGAFVILALLIFATASFGMGVLSAKAASTL